MKRYMIYSLFLFVIGGCTKAPNYPIIPEISYKNFDLFYSIDNYGDTLLYGELHFDVIDGDGDIGNNSNADDTSKVYLRLYAKENNNYVLKYSEDTLRYSIPYVTPDGNNKNLKAEIVITFEYQIVEFDTVKYEFYIVDRATHHSNIESTDDLVLY